MADGRLMGCYGGGLVLCSARHVWCSGVTRGLTQGGAKRSWRGPLATVCVCNS